MLMGLGSFRTGLLHTKGATGPTSVSLMNFVTLSEAFAPGF